MRALPRRAWCSLKSISMSPIRTMSVGRLLRAGAAQDGAHARQELGDRKRLGDVIVGAEFEPEHLVGLRRARRQHDDRRGVRARAQLAADVEAVLLRQHDVENHEIGREAGGAGESLVAVRRRLHFVAFELEVVTQTEQHLRFVLDHQNALHDGLPPQARVRMGPRRGDGEVQREGAAVLGLAVHAHEAAVAAHRVIDNRQTEAAALAGRRRGRCRRDRTCGRSSSARGARCRCRGP